MKKVLLAFSGLTLLASCATFTLVTLNVDAKTLIPASAASGEIAAPATGGSTRIPSDTGGTVSSLPQLSFLEKGRVQLGLTVAPVQGNATDINLTVDLFIGPSSAADVFTSSYMISTTPVTVTPTTGSQPSLNVVLDPKSTDPALQGALTALKSGSFKYGLRIASAPSTGGKVTYQVNTFNVSVTGYPIKILKP
jgi:hypothetical protein